MRERRNIYAYTSPAMPAHGNGPFISINEEEDGSVSIHVRGEPYATGAKTGTGCIVPGAPVYANPEATYLMPTGSKDELCMLFCSLGEYLYGDKIMAATGKHIMSLVTAGPDAITTEADRAVKMVEDRAETLSHTLVESF